MTSKKFSKTKYTGVYRSGVKAFCWKISRARRRDDGTLGDLWGFDGYTTAKDAHEARTEALSKLKKGTLVAPTKVTVGDFLLESWLPAVRDRIRATTLSSYETIIKVHVRPKIGQIPIQRLMPADLNAFYADRIGSGLAPKTVRNIHVVLRKALGDGLKWGILARNVAELADPPKVNRSGSPDMRTWTAIQLGVFLQSVAHDRLHPAFRLASYTGMRRGEVLGLRWEDVDFNQSRVAVRQTLVCIGYKTSFSTPKTEKSRRSISLDAETLEALSRHRRNQLEERLALGPTYQDADLVFAERDGSPIHPQGLSEAFEKAIRASDAPRIRFHDLRHTHATLMLQANIHPKVVSERLGHATISITLDTYSHAIPAMDEAAVQRFAALIN